MYVVCTRGFILQKKKISYLFVRASLPAPTPLSENPGVCVVRCFTPPHDVCLFFAAFALIFKLYFEDLFYYSFCFFFFAVFPFLRPSQQSLPPSFLPREDFVVKALCSPIFRFSIFFRFYVTRK